MITGILTLFLVGYLAIIMEHSIRINKAATALLTGTLCWIYYAMSSSENSEILHQLSEHLAEISGILFFLMGAMTIVELIDAHDGFEIVKSRITTRSKRKMLWLISILAFFLSAVLDNLTTTIVMVSLLRKLLPRGHLRFMFASVIILAANAGGAWSPIGDVTTTMLWIGGKITTSATITHLILPSIIALLVPLLIITWRMDGTTEAPVFESSERIRTPVWERNLVFFIGLLSLIFVPVFKAVTHLPPYMGILTALGIMWIITEIIHYRKDELNKDKFSVLYALRKIDMPSILFFLGILLAIGVLQHVGILRSAADWLDEYVGNMHAMVILIGILSAIIDNVPLVAGAMGMYDMSVFPVDHSFWLFLAYCAGTGGSMLIIGSAAGVAAMGMEKISFLWYVRHFSWLALLGYAAGAGVYILQTIIF